MLRKEGCQEVDPWSSSGWPFKGTDNDSLCHWPGAGLRRVVWGLGGPQVLSLFPEQGYLIVSSSIGEPILGQVHKGSDAKIQQHQR